MLNASRNDTVAVGTTAVAVSNAKIGYQGKRRVINIRNNSTSGQTITVSFSDSSVAVAGSGIVLKPGDTITDSVSEGYNPWQGKITAISDAASGVLAVYEVVY